MARSYRYLLADVFTEAALGGGNPLAVFPDARGLADGEMQALARELNLSETTFCLPPDGEADARVRVFTVSEELPFAGHPTLGTAAVLRCMEPRLRGAAAVRLELRAGVVPVRFPASREDLPWGAPIHGEMEQPPPSFGQEHAPERAAALLGLPVEALDRTRPVLTVSTGLPFAVALLRDLDALAHLAVREPEAEEYLRGTDARFFYALAPAGPGRWRARMQFYGREDPATGSAAGCAAAYLVRQGLAAPGAPHVIEQGVEMGRACRIEVRAALEGGPGTYVRVGGSTVLVAEGRFFLP